MLKPYLHILPEMQRKLWPDLAPCKDLGFCLYGDTAIALQRGHRASVDFDFFSHQPLDEAKEKAILEKLPFLADAVLGQTVADTRTYTTKEGVTLSFFGNIDIGRVGEPSMTADGVLQVASLQDLMASKLTVMLKRAEKKDYRDIAAILRSGMDLHDGLAYAQALYKQFLPMECVRAMACFDDPKLQSLSQEDKEILVNAAQNFRPDAVPCVAVLSSRLTSTLENSADGADEAEKKPQSPKA